jgi:hypothetical protein
VNFEALEGALQSRRQRALREASGALVGPSKAFVILARFGFD